MTIEMLSLAAGAVLSLAFSYIPGLSDWFSTLNPIRKRAVFALVLFLVALAIFGLTCANLILPGVVLTCSTAGAWLLVQTFILALVASQGMFMISPQKSNNL